MNITVYLGASIGKNKIYKEKCKELGEWIAKNGNVLVYGGSKTGLMGVLAEAAIKSKGEVIGVEPRFFIEDEVQYNDLTKLIITEDMAERKVKMIELGEAFIAFPGGSGTLEEISEVISKCSLKHLHAPCIFYNINGYYDNLKEFFAKTIDEGFSSKERLKDVYFLETLEDISSVIAKYK